MASCRRIPFVEPKVPDWERIAEICDASARAQRWANFGPVSETLAGSIASIVDLPSDRMVVVSSSATTALQAVAGMHAVRAGRPLRWLISAFGFFSTAVNVFAGRVKIVDCKPSGLLDLEAVDRLDAADWDGLIVTNVFGLYDDLSIYDQFCRERGKRLIFDSAVAFPQKYGRQPYADEVISFHHTKPWGFGEGGCAIVERDAAAAVRSFLNFGVGVPSEFAPYATNGKISDLSAAAILARLERLHEWSIGYFETRDRIRAQCSAVGISTLGRAPDHMISPHLPVLAPRPTPIENMPAARFDVRKYYRPLAPGHPTATKLYDHIVNFPCHRAMNAVSDEEIGSFLEALKGEP